MTRVRWYRSFILFFAAFFIMSGPVAAQLGDEGPRHPEIPSLEEILDALDARRLDVDDIRRLGLSVFSTPFNTYDGHGDGPFDPNEWLDDPLAFGHRPTLQGNGQVLRVNGLDAQSCNECHSIVSNRTTPPSLGIGGVGGMVQNAIIVPSLIDVADSSDDRVIPGHTPDLLPLVADGVADFSGRFANPPFLFGGGGVELLAKEMTADLQSLLEEAQNSPAGAEVNLYTHGVSFGSLISLGDGDVDLTRIEGIGFEDNSGRDPRNVLVVRPFGRKGENFTMRDFDRGAMQFHFGVQPVEVVDPDGLGGVDEDGDGVSEEVTVAEMSVLHVFDVTNPTPRALPLGRRGKRGSQLFNGIGCARCHVPVLLTRSRFLPLAHPEVPHDPFANVYLEIDLVEVGFTPAPGGGVFVPLFADLKRHAMGARLAETFERGEIAQGDFTTARLWGIADTAPYLHDARATTIFQAIETHGGEAQTARDRFIDDLNADQQRDLLFFLSRLRVPEKPNVDLLENDENDEDEDDEDEDDEDEDDEDEDDEG